MTVHPYQLPDEQSQLHNVPVDKIDASHKREPDPARVAELAESIADTGLLQPVVIDGEYRLVFGRHRLAAIRSLGFGAIPAIMRSFDTVTRELAEIDEDLIRKELTVLERSELTARRKKLYEQLHPATKVGGAPGKKGGGKKPKNPESRSFVSDTAERTGRGKSTISEDVKIGGIADDARELLRDTEFANNKSELLALAKLPRENQAAAAARLTAGEAKPGKEAAALTAGTTPASDEGTKPAIFSDEAALRRGLGLLRECVIELNIVLKGWVARRDVDVVPTIPMLKTAVKGLKASIKSIETHIVPFVVCSLCKNQGECSACGGKGWLSQAELAHSASPSPSDGAIDSRAA